MRIIHVSEAFGGGLRSAIINYVQATDDHEHLIFARARAGHETFDVPVSARFVEYRGGLFGFLFEARAFVLQQRADIVHLHSSYAGLLRALLPSGIRIVYSPHCYAMETGRPAMKRAVYWSVERMLAQRPQMLMAVGPREAELGHHLRSAMPIREVPNCATPVSAPDVAPVDDDTAAPSGSKPTIVMVGRVADQKDPQFFAAVAEQLGTGRFDYVWIGEGDEGRHHLDRAGVRITGWVDPARTRSLLRSAGLYLHSAAWEGAPLSTIEASVMGCPVLCRSIPSMAALGYPLAGATVSEVAATTNRFFADADFHADVVRRSSRIAQDFSFSRMQTRLSAAYAFAERRLGDGAPPVARAVGAGAVPMVDVRAVALPTQPTTAGAASSKGTWFRAPTTRGR
ncbi:glycosyltransferase [Rhodococcoides kroppenstedtii]|uniref:glycosyltransferase n=1 Tax=Rhodococcoides kroppenstedtii TaxID=293050 RepID=UPI001BDE8FF0|nr:glycosyltransferase [Rhodococcus kroppenstedtii]MBT1191109.1 glycosyltransferase [Rhodococcus kroppenstedtii]